MLREPDLKRARCADSQIENHTASGTGVDNGCSFNVNGPCTGHGATDRSFMGSVASATSMASSSQNSLTRRVVQLKKDEGKGEGEEAFDAEPVRITVALDAGYDQRSRAPLDVGRAGISGYSKETHERALRHSKETHERGGERTDGEARVFKISEFENGFIFKANAATVDEVKRRNLFGRLRDVLSNVLGIVRSGFLD